MGPRLHMTVCPDIIVSQLVNSMATNARVIMFPCLGLQMPLSKQVILPFFSMDSLFMRSDSSYTNRDARRCGPVGPEVSTPTCLLCANVSEADMRNVGA